MWKAVLSICVQDEEIPLLGLYFPDEHEPYADIIYIVSFNVNTTMEFGDTGMWQQILGLTLFAFGASLNRMHTDINFVFQGLCSHLVDYSWIQLNSGTVNAY